MDEEQADRLDVALGHAVRLTRRRRNMSQSDLGDAVGVSFQQIQKYERGSNRISFSMLVRIADALGCSVADLVAEVEELAGAGLAGNTLVQPEAADILEALSGIGSPRVRKAIVEFARAMAREV